MLLVVDIGNTNTVVGVYTQDKLLSSWRISSNHARTVDECGILIKHLCKEADIELLDITGVAIASVVPPLTSIFEEMSIKFLRINPLIVNTDINTGIEICYDDPTQVGADRIVNALAAHKLYGGPIIIVDLGTATTFDVVSEDGKYLGGVIAPGIETSSEELFRKTAKLPRVEFKRPKHVIGKNTEECLQSGIIFGAIGAIDEIVHRIESEWGVDAKVIATGGLAGQIAKDSRTIDEVNPFLTLEGLKLIYEINTASK